MKKSIAITSALLVLVGLSYAWGAAEAKKADDHLLSHSVYFALKEPTPEARQKLVDSCKQRLSQHPGVVYFAAGTLCDEVKGGLNVRDFDVVLLMVFSRPRSPAYVRRFGRASEVHRRKRRHVQGSARVRRRRRLCGHAGWQPRRQVRRGLRLAPRFAFARRPVTCSASASDRRDVNLAARVGLFLERELGQALLAEMPTYSSCVSTTT